MNDLERMEWERDEALQELEEARDEIAIQHTMIEELRWTMDAMARRLDRLDPPRIERQNTVTAEWRGPSGIYDANAAEINHELAQMFSAMVCGAEMTENPPKTDEMQRIQPNVIEINAPERRSHPSTRQAGPDRVDDRPPFGLPRPQTPEQ